MALNNAVPQTGDGAGRIVHVHEEAVRRQILEQMGRALEEQRQEEFDAAGADPGAQRRDRSAATDRSPLKRTR